MSLMLLTKLPDEVLYKILCFVSPPNNIVTTVCQSLVPLCHATKLYIDTNDTLWESILGGYYLSCDDHNRNDDNDKASSTTLNSTLNTTTTNRKNRAASTNVDTYRARTQRRSSKRLRRTTAKEDVIHAHLVLRDQTEMALQEVAEIAIFKTPHTLSLARLRSILKTYGPNVKVNQRSAIGGTFLVDCTRARHIKESVILSCVKELIEKYGASPYIPALEQGKRRTSSSNKGNNNSNSSATSSTGNSNTLPPLVIAAARGMPSVVKYLLTHDDEEGTLMSMEGTSRFRLFTNAKKSICGTYTPLQFAQKMKEAEIENGANIQTDLKSLNQCIRLLSSTPKRSIKTKT
mmetsp:Transcript_11004/g.16645  ORF Transcript_11004/g.16645 Transcript_11004/m.16645 type:complete len:347 (+) Transcript_11004:1325-2365(+)